jgi:hypothetical protein
VRAEARTDVHATVEVGSPRARPDRAPTGGGCATVSGRVRA